MPFFVSGPYSILFIDPAAAASSNGTYLLNRTNEQTIVLERKEQENETFLLEDNRSPQNNTICTQNKPFANCTQTLSNLTHRRDIPGDNVQLGGYHACTERPEERQVHESGSANNSYDLDNKTLTKSDLSTLQSESNANLTFLPINKSCENLLHDSSIEVKRRRTSNPKNKKLEHLLSRNLNENIDRPSSLPQSRSNLSANIANLQPLILNQISYSTPLRPQLSDNNLFRLRLSSIGALENLSTNDSDSKRDSLECEESLGILTPGQIEENPSPFDGFLDDVQFVVDTSEMQSPLEQFADSKTVDEAAVNSSDHSSNHRLNRVDERNVPNSVGLDNTVTYEDREDPGNTNAGINNTFAKYEKFSNHNLTQSVQAREELPSPNLNSTTESKLLYRIIDDQILSNATLITDTTMNLDLALDSTDKSNFNVTRLEQTPSPEELPLDPTPIVEMDSKIEPMKSKTSNCFITSITSITSIDTGYQGDGEMSRPASRGADNSPLTRRPLPRPQPRRQDPMTDSDFYTESDADIHEENPLRGDRKAQVIDGTLYGVDPQAAADIYVNNRENMDSSGIFTDLENNTR